MGDTRGVAPMTGNLQTASSRTRYFSPHPNLQSMASDASADPVYQEIVLRM